MNNIKFLIIACIFSFPVVFTSCAGSGNSGVTSGSSIGNKGAFPAEYKSEKQFKKRNQRLRLKKRDQQRRSQGKKKEDCDCPYKQKEKGLGQNLF